MAHRELTTRFQERRASLRKRNLRFFRLRASEPGSSRFPLGAAALFRPKQRGKAHAMERALLQDAEEPLGDGTSETQKPGWTRYSEHADEAIRLLHVKLEYLQLLHTRRLMIRFDDTEEEHDREITHITEEITTLFHTADRSLKQVTSSFKLGEPPTSTADRRVRLNTQRAIAHRLQDISMQFRTRQREYLQRLQLQKFGSEIFDVDSMETGAIGWKRSGAITAAEVEADEMQRDIRARDAEIRRIAKSVATLATLFKEVAEMVIDQGTLVDRIDYNMEQVATHARSGLKQLQRAERMQRNTRPERCICVLVTLILLCFVLLVLKHS